MSTVDDALQALTDLTPGPEQLLADVLAGLSQRPRQLPSKYFYDAIGSRLFEQITTTPEYYLTRTELALLRQCLPDIAAAVGPRAHVVELGSGSGRKTALLLDGLQQPVAYTPVEISRTALLSSIDRLAPALPEVEMLLVCADFIGPLQVPPPARRARRRLLFFPGSTLGNFTPEQAVQLLRGMRRAMADDGLALLGIDLHKDPAMIEAAYNDAAGITAAFTLNLLTRLNREIGGDFDLQGFRHRACYDPARLRIETDLVSLRDQQVHLGGQGFTFQAGEAIRVEYSHKYTDASFQRLLDQAGLVLAAAWNADQPAYGLRLLRAA